MPTFWDSIKNMFSGDSDYDSGKPTIRQHIVEKTTEQYIQDTPTSKDTMNYSLLKTNVLADLANTATLNEIYNNVFSDSASELRNRCTAAVLKIAAYILNEVPETANHANRLVWARATLANEASLKAASEKMYIGLASNATIQSAGNTASDNDIDWVVATLLDSVYAAG